MTIFLSRICSWLTEMSGSSNAHRYVVATQSQTLRQQLRKIPGVPIVHIKRSVMVLEPVSDASENVKDKVSCLLSYWGLGFFASQVSMFLRILH